MPLIKDDQQGGRIVPPPTAPTPKPRQANRTPQPAPAPAAAPPVAATPPPTGKATRLAQLEPPNPVLQQHGYNGGINGFNSRVQNVVDTYKKAYGIPPAPGLVFDLARSKVPDDQFSRMFTVPLNQQAAKAQQTNTLHSGDTIVVRHDGYTELDNPGRKLLYNDNGQQTPPGPGAIAPAPQPSRTVKQYQALQGQHPWVAAGMLPLPDHQLSAFWDAVKFAQTHGASAKPLTVGGETLAQYQQENQIGESLTGSRPGENPGLVNQGYGKAASTSNLATASMLADREQVARGVTSVKQAQDRLKQLAPAYFDQLPSDGFINQDWAKAIGKYQSSAQYFRQQTVQLAQTNHFGDNTAAFIHAWKAKQSAIRKQPFLASFLEHQPLAFFDTRTNGAAVRNLITGNAKGWGWANIPTIALSGLANVAGVAFDEVSGTLDQAKLDSSYVAKYMQAIAPKNQSIYGFGVKSLAPGLKPAEGEGLTEKQAREQAAKVLAKNPNWIRVFDPAFTGTGHEHLIGQVANAGIDLWLGAPKLTGETVGAGDIAAAKASRYFGAKTEFAYNALKAGKLGEATASLEGGLGAERLNTLLEDAAKTGDVSLAQYQQHASELFSHGKTTVGDTPVSGALFRSLRTKDLPTPGRVGSAAADLRAKVSALTDQWENTLRARKQVGATSHAADYIASVRQITARAAPAADKRYIFDERLPQDVYNWARVNLKDQKIAASLRDDLIRLRSKDDIQGIVELKDRINSLYAKAHPGSELAKNPIETEGPSLESESRSYLSFPHELETRAQKINAGLNKVGRMHRQVIVGGSPFAFPPIPGGGESLFWKHTIADTTRRVVGGGGFLKVPDDAKALVDGYLHEKPEAIRTVGVARSAAKMGENRWISGFRPTDVHSFNTGDFITDPERMKAAGAYLRHHLTSKALKAFQQSTADNLGPLVDLIRTDKEFQAITFKDVKTFTPTREWQPLPDGLVIPTGAEIMERNNLRYVRWPGSSEAAPSLNVDALDKRIAQLELRVSQGGRLDARDSAEFHKAEKDLAHVRAIRAEAEKATGTATATSVPLPEPIRYGGVTATEGAQALYRRYKEIEDAGLKAGIADPLNSALDVAVKHAGPKADAKLGEWVQKHGLGFPVRDGVVERKQFDDLMQRWIGALMTANKWNRGRLFDHVFYNTVNDLVGKAGWEVGDAVPVAADLAKAQTVYHMLDFSNMLQVEQNLRWLSYFATKHRLYWTWILKQAVRRPGLTAAVADAKDHLDQHGNLNFQIFGRDLYVPAARLFWVNAAEYPQTSPLVQYSVEAGKGLAEGHGPVALADAMGSLTSTSGNVLTRDDQAEMLGIKLALVSTGRLKPTAAAVTEGMPAAQAAQFNDAVNGYAAGFRVKHGDWPTEEDAVKHVLMHETARQFWSTNLPFPVLWNGTGSASPKVKAELVEYGRIANPEKKRLYLDQHPELAARFGVSQDPAVYLHNNRLWDSFNAAYKQVEQQRQQILNQILTTGKFTGAISKQMTALSQAWSAKIDQLKMEDAATWPGSAEYKPGKVSDGKVVQAGPWGISLEGDPFASRAFIHDSFPGVAKPSLTAHTVGERIVDLQNEAATLRAAKTPKQIAALGYPDAQHVTDRLSQINQILAPFFAYPKNAPAQIQSAYYTKFVVPYQKQRDAKTLAIANAPEDQQDALRSALRAWKDDHDHPVKMEWQGHTISFPSVVQIGWSRLPDAQRTLGLQQAVIGDWAHIASYEKTMLGVKTSAAVSEGWSLYASTVRDYTKNPSNPSLVTSQRTAIARQIDKAYPGFYKDYLFAQQPKLDRFMATSLYRQMPRSFYQTVVEPARQFIRAIKENGHRTYYEKAWRNAVETQLMPYIDQDPQLKKALTPYGPNFLNTLVSAGG